MRRAALLLLTACAASPRFPLREPMWRDADLDPLPGKPKEYVSSFAWDGFDHIVARPLTRFFSFPLPHEATNVNAFDEVPDSAWFTNRIGRTPMTVEEFQQGPCGDDTLPVDDPDGSWVIDHGKDNGANPGFRIKLPDGRKYQLKADEVSETERASGASAVSARFYHAAGWWTPCEHVIWVRRTIFKLKPGLSITDNTGNTKPFDEKRLKQILDNANQKGDLVRLSASKWLSGVPVGPFSYEGKRDDDPNDVIPHEDRRDLRGARVIAAWLGHFDAREQNTLDVWLAAGPDPDGPIGHVRHYYIDFGDCFGSQWSWDQMSRRLNHSYYLDFGHVLADFLTLGFIIRPWDEAYKRPDGWIFGYFNGDDFDPEAWKPGYPNGAFNEMTERDAAWGARIIARFTDEHIAAAVKVGLYTQEDYLVKTLIKRRDKILLRWLSVVSPVTDLRVEGEQVCGVDLARRSGLFRGFSYHARVRDGMALRVDADEAGGVCFPVPRTGGYQIIELTNGQARNPLVVHVHDGGDKGLQVVGIQRPD
jgi:hypothetical protein